ncbi:Cuticlin-4 [Trichinella pseudospiralis]
MNTGYFCICKSILFFFFFFILLISIPVAHNSEIPCDRNNVETAVQRFWIVDFDPVMNQAKHYDITCNSSGMHVIVHMERPFTGTVHLADRSSQCRTVVESADSFAIFFPNNEANVGCNIKEKDNLLTATLIFSNQQANLPQNAIFGGDAVDEVQCLLESASASSNSNNSKLIYTHTGLSVIEQETAAPASIVQETTVHRQAHLEILRDSSPVKQVYIGETLLLSIWADYDAEGIFVENCSVTDAVLKQPLLPLIVNGCSVEPSIIGHFHHVPDRLQASFQAFKMADAEQLHFQCVIKFCNDWCPQVECDNGATVVVTRGATRFRRIVNGIEQKSETIYSSVETLISILPKESNSTTPSQQLIGLTSQMLNDSEAQSWKFATSVVLLFALSLLLGFLFCLCILDLIQKKSKNNARKHHGDDGFHKII